MLTIFRKTPTSAAGVEKKVSDDISAETVPKKPHVVNSTDKPTEETPAVVIGNVESTETEVPKGILDKLCPLLGHRVDG